MIKFSKGYKINLETAGLHEMFGFKREMYEDWFEIGSIVLVSYYGKTFNEGRVLDDFINRIAKDPRYDLNKPEIVALVALICGKLTAAIRLDPKFKDFHTRGGIN